LLERPVKTADQLVRIAGVRRDSCEHRSSSLCGLVPSVSAPAGGDKRRRRRPNGSAPSLRRNGRRSVWNLYRRPAQMVGRVVEWLVVEIAEGRFLEGTSMPAVRTLAAQAGCSPGPVVRAYGGLESLGLVARRDRSRARVVVGARVRARMLLGAPRPVRLSGSDEPALDLL